MQDTPPYNDQYWMFQALERADRAAIQGEVPVGAIVVKDNKIVGEGWNQSIRLHDPSAHAEMMAIRQAGLNLSNYRLVDTTLYVTLEPCCMCAGLLVHSRIGRLVYGANDVKTGAAGSFIDLLGLDGHNHQIEVTAGVLAEQCGEKLSGFFRDRRAQKKAAKSAGS